MPKRVLILCTGNCCRSQLAEALWNHEAAGQWVAFSAGVDPARFVHQRVLQVLAELGLDGSTLHSKEVEQFQGETFDLVLTLSESARRARADFPAATVTRHWPVRDPFQARGDAEQKLEAFRQVRDELRRRIRKLLRNDAPPSPM